MASTWRRNTGNARGATLPATARPARIGSPPLDPASRGADPREEHQVRLTAQRLLHTHLRRDAGHHWADIDLDLTGATLTSLDLTRCTVHGADFSRATFSGIARFNEGLESAIVTDSAAGHEPPPDWRIERSEGGAGRFCEPLLRRADPEDCCSAFGWQLFS
ncbi:hypothetical protein E1289_07670 [Actinomadura sp. 6K520]|nr:hypothetical protein E1289_07670 [Actinomadura sp. 6K520]